MILPRWVLGFWLSAAVRKKIGVWALNLQTLPKLALYAVIHDYCFSAKGSTFASWPSRLKFLGVTLKEKIIARDEHFTFVACKCFHEMYLFFLKYDNISGTQSSNASLGEYICSRARSKLILQKQVIKIYNHKPHFKPGSRLKTEEENVQVSERWFWLPHHRGNNR